MAASLLGNRDLIRAINRSHILNVIKNHGSISRADIARITGLSPATVTGITAKLLTDNLIVEQAAGLSSGGRPPILLTINPKGGCVIGIKVSEEHLVGALTDLNASVFARQTLPLAGMSVQAVVDQIVDLVAQLIKIGAIRRKQLLGVGVGLAGVVDSESGILKYSPYFHWRDVDLCGLLQARLKVPVNIDNDVNTFTLFEKWFGTGLKASSFLTITVGRGLGMGIVVNGQIYRGKNGGAGEFGHTIVDVDGPQCSCGHRGCLETFVSDPALLAAAQKAAGEGKLPVTPGTLDEVIALANAGAPEAQAIFARAGSLLGLHLANLINILAPEVIVIGGEGTRIGKWFFEPMRQAIRPYVTEGMENVTEIHVEPWGDDAWARGAASLVLAELFKSPIYKDEPFVAAR